MSSFVSGVQLFTQQVGVLLWKNYLVCKRSWKLSVLRLLLPTLFLVFYYIIYLAANRTVPYETPAIVPLSTIPKCKIGVAGSCVTLLYSPDTPTVRQIMSYVGQNNNPPLVLGQDIVYTPLAIRDLDAHLLKVAPNTTQGAVYFDLNPDNWAYTIMYNASDAATNYNVLDFDVVYSTPVNFKLEMQVALESAMASTSSEKPLNVKISTKWFPDYQYGEASRNSLVDSVGMLFYFLGLTGGFIAGLNGIATERERRIRGYLRCAGVMDSAFWIAWFIELFWFQFLSTLLMLLFGYTLPGLVYFQKANFFANLSIFTVYGIELICMAFLISTFCNTSRLANILGLMIYFAGMIMSLVFSFIGTNFYVLWNTQFMEGHWDWPKILSFFPPFLFCKAVNDVGVRTITGLLSFADPNNPPPGFKWEDMNNHPDATAGGYAPTTSTTLGYMIMFGTIFAFLAWYLDNIISDTFGARRAFYFPFQPSFWGLSKKAPYSRTLPLIPASQSGQVSDEDLRNEQNISTHTREALKIVGLSKTYKKLFGKNVEAVKHFYLKSDSGVLLALLGHNGAGKTTTINVLTGLSSATAGDAFIYGYSVTHDMDEIRALTGTCPQFDVFWPELTAEEHLRILSGMKSSARNDKMHEGIDILKRLEEVRLLKVKDHQVQTFSGGMRRRLSMALATVGNPKVVILDEPTTGVDPANRRYIWKMIQDLKTDRLVILTTHSMEEADVLGEKIAIMSHGELKCVGTSLHLKSKFGTGYRINFIADVDKVPPLKEMIQRMLPEAQLFAENAGSLIYVLPEKLDDDHVARFFNYMHDLDKDDRLARDWGISNTTLEDVFLRVTR